MFELAESDPSLSDNEAKRLIPQLRTRLLREQYKFLENKDRALLILIGGIDGAGKGDTINLLNDWMDARHIHTMAFTRPTEQDRIYPRQYRFWRALPAKGEIGIVFGSGYAPLMEEALKKRPDPDVLEDLILAARRYEADLVANGVQVIKLWFHLSKKAQRARMQTLLENPSTAWKVAPEDHDVPKRFKRLRQAAQRIIESTDSAHAPWVIIPAADENMRMVRTGQAVLQALQNRSVRVPPLHDPAVLPTLKRQRNPLTELDYSAQIDKDNYQTELLDWQNRLAKLVRSKAFLQKHALMVVFEGSDAAGKGGTIRRITQAIDARQYDIMPVAAPKPFELDRPYLWRFWRHVPRLGRISIFDRSWYGRVLVERVEKLIPPSVWRRAYAEINGFEQQLTHDGVLVVKFWLAITPDEQLKRFKEREAHPYKQYKLTSEDWRNRRKWKSYENAAADMLVHTDTSHAGWHLIPANDKRHARIEVLKQLVKRIEQAIDDDD
ncbi:MAG: polyphosphate:AMP phosphotransferase [Burkholderiaceae bacterium]|nr:polyphosphate:AMP phosphotransferase [Burkholderiaceae bacterium]MCD8517139.1 polyphosphate:AMP phosphotransferase [Burkholderiaceae bacterium]MCD8536564.1 polyphosphate:AMP phosphotransferase [Burkholderiaceae bacterium]MCD8565315.1 polyphosphate:AMP phosphotransferase [Burkholderiaceae bacterium]